MNTPNNVEPAFPCKNWGNQEISMPGMSLRDWFAGKALEGFFASEAEYSFQWTNNKGEKRLLGYGCTPSGKDADGWVITRTPDQAMAAAMYAAADAMLAERAKGTQ